MMDFNILHLSDLHITSESDFTKLLSDIQSQTQTFRELVIIVTGDIVDRGKYNQEREDIAIAFFKNLKQILGEKFKACFFVPRKIQNCFSSILSSYVNIFDIKMSEYDIEFIKM